jgi:hypothetical protein
MSFDEVLRLRAEHAALKLLLHEIPIENAIDRLSLQARMDDLEHSISRVTIPGRRKAQALLAFRGKPVVGHHGIFAEFGAAAVQGFTEAVATIAASLASGPLGARGVIPSRDEYQMLITGTVPGSFGFELEEYQRETDGQRNLDFPEGSPVEQAIEQARALMQATLGSDDDLADAASGMDPRAVGALRQFITILAVNGAACSLEVGGREFVFSDLGQVERSAGRLSQENIHEHDEQLDGEFRGVLPKRRTFEFKLASTGEIISGKVSPAIADAGEINTVLGQPVIASAKTTRVGDGRPRYQILSYQPINVPSERHTGD